jgi:hypothetical protein
VERLQVKLDGILSMSPFYFTASCAEHAAVDSSRSQRLPIERRAARIRSADSRTWRGRTAYLERFIHREIYKAHPEVRAVVHSHSSAVIPFGVVSVALRPIFHLGGFLGAGCQYLRYATPAALRQRRASRCRSEHLPWLEGEDCQHSSACSLVRQSRRRREGDSNSRSPVRGTPLHRSLP